MSLEEGRVYKSAEALASFGGQHVSNELLAFVFTSFVLLISWIFESSECRSAGEMKQTLLNQRKVTSPKHSS
jgi:hypothetical protein